jgi:hypothetical protein
MSDHEIAELRCTACGLETDHTLRYAGSVIPSKHWSPFLAPY